MKKLIFALLLLMPVMSGICQSSSFFHHIWASPVLVEEAGNGYYIVFPTYSGRPVLMRNGPAGNFAWAVSYLGLGSLHSAVYLPGKGFAFTTFQSTPSRITLTGVDMNGTVVFSTAYTAPGFTLDSPLLCASPGNGFVLSGSLNSSQGPDTYCIRTDSIGTVMWSKMYTDSNAYNHLEPLAFLCDSADGGVLFSSYLLDLQGGHKGTVKTDASGNIVWAKEYMGGVNVVQTSSGYTFLDQYDDFPTGKGIDIFRTDAMGSVINGTHFQETTDGDYAELARTSNGGYIVGGYNMNTPNSMPVEALIRFDSNLNIAWARRYGDLQSGYSPVHAKETSDGGIVAVSAPNWIKTDAQGSTCLDSVITYNSSVYTGAAIPWTTVITSNLNVSDTVLQVPTEWLTPLLNLGCITGIENIPAGVGQVQIYPNPNSGSFSIELNSEAVLSVMDILGKRVYSSVLNAGMNTIHLYGAAPGVYLLRLEKDNGEVEVKKVILQ